MRPARQTFASQVTRQPNRLPERSHANKAQSFVMLDRPEIPLPANASSGRKPGIRDP